MESEGFIEQQPVVHVEIDSLRLAGSPRLAGERPEHIEILATAPNPLPPIIVHRATMRVIDGFHRLRAAQLRGSTTIAVRFFDGDESAAFVLAVQLNVTHGLPLALADRQCAAERIVVSHPHWSDRRVASVTGISPSTVSEIRRRIAPGAHPGERRLGQDGRMRPVDGASGRLRAGELIAENPNLSLRQIAHAAGISPETVRDVRNRLRNGGDVLPKPRRTATVVATHPDSEPRFRKDRAAVRPDPAAAAFSSEERVALVKRLTADPSLRFSETGRNLLRLLAAHTVRTDEWDAIINSVPPHCSGIVANLAGQVADMWADLAVRIRQDVTAVPS